MLGRLDQLLMHLRSRLDRGPIRDRVANHAGLKLNLRLYHFTVLDELLDVEHCEGLSNGDEECIIGDVTARADAAAVAEDEFAWVRFGFVGWGFEKAFRPKGHGLRVDGGVVGEPPRALVSYGVDPNVSSHVPSVGHQHGALWDSVSSADVLCGAGVG